MARLLSAIHFLAPLALTFVTFSGVAGAQDTPPPTDPATGQPLPPPPPMTSAQPAPEGTAPPAEELPPAAPAPSEAPAEAPPPAQPPPAVEQVPVQQPPPQQPAPQQLPPPPTQASEPPPPQIDPHEGGIRMHDGFYLRVGIGAGLMRDSVESDRSVFDGKMSGGGGMLEFMLGATPLPGFVVGVGVQVSVTNPNTSKFVPKEGSELDLDNEWQVGAVGIFADYYFNPAKGFHTQLFLGSAQLQTDGGLPGPDQPDRWQGVTLTSGTMASLGVGYEWFTGEQWSFGALGRLAYAAFDEDYDWYDFEVDERVTVRNEHSVWMPGLMLSITYH